MKKNKITFLPTLLFIFITILGNALRAQEKEGQARIDSLLHLLHSPAYAIAGADSMKIDLLNTISYCYRYINPDEGIKYASQGLALAEKNGLKSGIAQSNNALGGNYRIKSDYTKALECFSISLKMNEDAGNKSNIANLTQNVGNVYSDLSDFPKALEYYFKSLKINEELGEKAEISGNCFNIGVLYLEQNDNEKALIYFLKSLKIDEEMNKKGSVAEGYGAIGGVYSQMGNNEKALEYFFKSLKIEEELGFKSLIQGNLSNIGYTYAIQKKYAAAIEYNLKALKLCEEIGEKKGIAVTFHNIGSDYLEIAKSYTASVTYKEKGITKTESISHSLEYLNKSVNLYLEIGELHPLPELYFSLYEVQELSGNYKDALENYKLSIKIKDSIFSEENKAKIAALGKQREEDVKQKEIEIQKLQLDKAKNERWYFIIGISLLIVLVFFVFRSLAVQKKLNKLISLQQEQAINNDRARISSEMHDDLGSGLSKISMLSELINSNTSNENMKPHLENISRSSREMVETMGDIIWSLNSKNDRLANLLSYSRKYAMEFFENTPIRCVVALPDNVPEIIMDGNARRNIFLVIKEALHNALKHSGATTITLKFEIEPHRFSVIISDNGKGIDASKLSEFGNGLDNMEKRMKETSGTFLIKNEGGTVIEITVPI